MFSLTVLFWQLCQKDKTFRILVCIISQENCQKKLLWLKEKLYSKKRPCSMQRVEAPYYLCINHSKNSSKCWFKASSMGVNKLTSLMKTMAGQAGFERRLTNHSVRKRMMQKLNDSNVPQTHIVQLSGHRNLWSVNNYSTLSKEQQKNMLILSDNSAPPSTAHAAKTSQTVPTAESSYSNSSVIPA